MKIRLTALVLAAAMLAGSGTAFAADTARASANISIYAGPGNGYEVIGKLKKNARVTLDRCTRTGSWCLFNDGDGEPVGWVRASYLIGIGAITRATPFHFLVNPDMTQLPTP
jgi:uncharacterized protein YraI